LWTDLGAPQEAIEYYSMPPDAKFRDLILAVRADEACHREVNHHFADIRSWEDVEGHHVELNDPRTGNQPFFFSLEAGEEEKKSAETGADKGPK
jgi:hypothetical protein